MNMKYFEYDHLPKNLQKVSAPLGDLARRMQLELPECDEKEAGLRKLLEAKDCFIRASMNTAPVVTNVDTLAYMILYGSVETLRDTEGRDSIGCVIALQSNPLIKIKFAYQFKRGIEIKITNITSIVSEHDAYIRMKLKERIAEEQEHVDHV